MAKNLTTIQMEYAKMKKQAAELDSVAAELRKAADTQFAGGMNHLSAAWKSDSAALFLKKCLREKEQISKQASDVKNAADTLRQIAKNTYEAEMQAYKLAQTRTYK